MSYERPTTNSNGTRNDQLCDVVDTSILEADNELLVNLDHLHLNFTNEEDLCQCSNCRNRNSSGQSGEIQGNESHNSWFSHCHRFPADNNSIVGNKRASKKLILTAIFCSTFMIIEFIGGYCANSLAIMSDAGHLLTDLLTIGLSLFAIWLSRKEPTKRFSYGFHRVEILGAMTSTVLIWMLTGTLVYFAIHRFQTNEFRLDSRLMMLISGTGILVNIMMGLILHGSICFSDQVTNVSHNHVLGHHHSHGTEASQNINVRAVLIHIIGDLLQSVGVFVASVVVHFEPNYKIADPICTLVFSIIVLYTTYKIMKDAILILMEATPSTVEYQAVRDSIQAISGVRMVHSLHIWNLTVDKTMLAVHVAVDENENKDIVLEKVEKLLQDDLKISETTVQVEKYIPSIMNSCHLCRQPTA